MAKLIKGDNVQNIITDGDVIVTSPSKIGKTLDEVLVEQQSDIDRLKSNVKYIYAYGGVGGSGSGGGSGSDEKPIRVDIALNGTPYKENNTIILDGKGKYVLFVKISNAGGKNLYVGYSINGLVTDKMMVYSMNGDNKYTREIPINLNTNGEINIRIDDDEGNTIGYYTQKYIVDSDILNVSLNYVNLNGETKSYISPFECHAGDPNRKNRHFKIDASIYLTNYTDVSVKCEIEGNKDIKNPIYEGSDMNVVLPIEGDDCKVFINGDEFLEDKHMGTYVLKATLSYTIDGGRVVKEKTLQFTIIPYDLYIAVRTLGNVLYDSIESLTEDVGSNGKPKRYITAGSSLMLYGKVFEGDIMSDKLLYPTSFDGFDMIGVDENEKPIWKSVTDGNPIIDTLIEQEESKSGVSITFPKHGIKRITFSTKSMKGNTGDSGDGVYIFEKFVYVDEFKSECDWYNTDRYSVFVDSYFRANQGDNTYLNFPTLSSNKEILNLTVLSNPVNISHPSWYEGISGNVCTIISLGIQVSDINSEDAKIVDIYQNGKEPILKYTLGLNSLFGKGDTNKIAIPTEVLDKNDNKKYHLVQIIRTANKLESGEVVEFEDSLYIDGIIESVNRSVSYTNLVINSLTLNNINICYNLINVQYCEMSKDNIDFNTDAYAYQYWLSYKEKYVNSQSDERLTGAEYYMIQNIIPYISFDGTNVVVDAEIIPKISQYSDLPTMVFSYDCVNSGNGKYSDISSFMEMMWTGRSAGDTSFGKRKIDLYWIPAGSGGTLNEWKVNIPELTNNSNGENSSKIPGNWEIELQGTSTMRNKIKNYTLRVNTGDNDNILFSPNFDKSDPSTFLPDIEWTIKADIADSAHANNTAIGKFVNNVCTKFVTKIPNITKEAELYVKNTLSGIPVLLYFRCKEGDEKEKIYYFGIYNFNLGRGSHYNLGYTGGIVDSNTGESDFMRVFNNISNDVDGKFYHDKLSGFAFAVGEDVLSGDVIVGEIQDNYPEFDFHQCQESLLFKNSEKQEVATMFGSDSKITSLYPTEAKNALKSLVRSIARAGKFCFMQAGREGDFITSMENSDIDKDNNRAYGGSCVNRYNEYKIPDIEWQMTYDNDELVWIYDEEFSNVNEVDLQNLITRYEIEGEENVPILNYTSASEYYTICMAFGMVDSVLKNMNLKNFQNRYRPQFYCAFYDMDCALEEDNSGEESVSYLAATDYWYSPVSDKTNQVSPIKKMNDYWDRVEGGQGFDFTSSYLLSVVKYAKSIFENKYSDDLRNYPQQFWASMRRKGGALESANHFIEEYFKSGIMKTFEYLASLNYRVKYLYRGAVLDTNNNIIVKSLANAGAFNGSRKVKVKNWLTKRLRFMDVMMNVNGLNLKVADNVTIRIPTPDNTYKVDLALNPDITILHSAFDTDTQNKLFNSFNGEVKISAPKNTPFIYSTPQKNILYLLPGGVDKDNFLRLDLNADVNTRFYGSGMFTSIDKIETMFTEYMNIVSDNLESITYGGVDIPLIDRGVIINCKSLKVIDLNIPNLYGLLNIEPNCKSLKRINIANSGLYGTFTQFPNLQEVNISGLKCGEQSFTVSGSNFLTGENICISGSDKDNKTSLNTLNISGVVGNFNCVNTNIRTISIQNNTKLNGENFDPSKLSELYISNDEALNELILTGFKKVSITGCNNLRNLVMDDALEELYINLEGVRDEDSQQQLVAIPYVEVKDPITGKIEVKDKGIFDLTKYPNLKKVTLINCDNLVHVKLPDNDIETDGISNNKNLKWIDTGILPAFHDTYTYKYNGGITPTYTSGPKLILCSSGAFNNCPQYAMLRSDYNDGKNAIRVDNENKNAGSYKAYTNIIVSEKCTSLNDTFSVNSFSSDDDFNMTSAIRFIEKCVPDGVKANIESLSNCFRGRQNISYDLNDAFNEKNEPETYHKHPTLSKYTSLIDISSMYYNTGVRFISKELLDLPFENNSTTIKKLSWGNFISGMQSNIDISNDALYNISYRLDSFSIMKFTIYKFVYNNTEKGYVPVGRNIDDMFAICDFFYPFSDDRTYSTESGWVFKEGVNPKIFDYITSITSLNFGEQYIDFRGMFNLFPNVQTISSFLNGNLSKYKMDGLLKPCKCITSIIQSFNDTNILNSTNSIDLYEFFNWNDTKNVTNLFEGTDNLTNGFVINKHITYENFKTILKKLEDYVTAEDSKLIRLTNIFSYCLITEYNNDEIKFDNKLEGVINISNLFENCHSDFIPFENESAGDKGIYRGGVLNIGRSFFENLPNVTVAQRTFANTYLSSSLTYDFFCKRSEQQIEKDIFILSDGEYRNAKLYEYEYDNSLINLKECFYNVKFVNCKNWFDQKDSGIIIRNYIELDDKTKIDTIGYEYYIYNAVGKLYELHTLDNDIFDDCLDNYTDYVPKNSIQRKYSEEDIVLYNHDLLQDFYYYHGSNIGKYDMPVKLDNEACEDVMYKTYCCLPPDILYGCDGTAEIDGIFANSNIIGVIPRNLTKKVKNQSISNIFKNVNIMPNLEYYYDKGGKFNSILKDIDIENEDTKGEDYTVIFRDEMGRLKKRKPVDGDRNLGQFVYVPANFTTCNSLVKAFNFRYNLPRHWEMPAAPNGHIGYYKTTKLFNEAISNGELNNMGYHTQYYFLTDNSVNWSNVRDCRNVFITSDEDIDFSNTAVIGKPRTYYDDNNEIKIIYKNTWTVDKCISKATEWLNNDNGVIINFYMDLNLCGKKNSYNMIEDNGCPIVIKNRNVKLDNFVSGILTVFLNGRVFDETFDICDLKTSYHKSVGGLPIVGYYGFGKNIILPKFTANFEDENFVFMPIDSNYVYYDFMAMAYENESIKNYELYFGNRLSQGKTVFVSGNKYTFKPQ